MIMTKQEFLISANLREQTLEFWLEQRWLIPDETVPEIRFSECAIARAGLIQDLQRDFGVNDAGIELILHLMDQLHGTRQALSLLRESPRFK
ncbi:MAG: chaperone modulator CbpM [Castellaniella sp.]|uniref:chaperone modulator CbpM n=1 Tax=Castellaniella sp. TaxID=1955812 RepID=UPI003C73491C